MTDYFKEVSTFEELRKKFIELSKQYHPDLHPVEKEQYYRSIFQEINKQYEGLSKKIKASEKMKSQFGEKTESYNYQVDEKLMEIIEMLIKYNCKVEVVGVYIWVSDTKKEDKDIYKNFGLKWHGNRKMWYYNPFEGYSRFAKNLSFEQIKDKYGSAEFKGKQRMAIGER